MPKHTTRDIGERAFSVALHEAKVFANKVERNFPLEDEIIQEAYQGVLQDLEAQRVDQLVPEPYTIKTARKKNMTKAKKKSKSKPKPKKKPHRTSMS